LRRLQTDWIDLYQVHRPDPHTAIDETVSALSDLVRAGKIRYWGTSTFPAPTSSMRTGRRIGRRHRTALRAAAVLDLLPRHRA
jgi:aryl-alcohol dehydrogenase-like predicted oxidoreductase